MTASDSSPSGLIDGRMSLGAAVLDDLFPSGEADRRSTVTYWVLLTLAAFVAAFGLFQDSVASIIGAMVIAPLGGAILAIAAALVPVERAGRSARSSRWPRPRRWSSRSATSSAS